jgi:hypothetical protein
MTILANYKPRNSVRVANPIIQDLLRFYNLRLD